MRASQILPDFADNTSDGARQVTNSSEDLSRMATALQTLVKQFKVE